MKKINSEYITKKLITHPYDSNPKYFAKINFLFFSKDKKVISGYWEAPRGWFEYECIGYDEINYIIEGEIEIIFEDGIINLKKGEYFIQNKGDRVKFNIKKKAKTIFFLYPTNEKVLKEINKMIKSSKRLKKNDLQIKGGI